jgi:predicted small lipoprotein YifL
MKKILAFILVLVMSVSLFACAGKTPQQSPDASPADTTPQSAAPPASPSPSESAGAFGERVLVGVLERSRLDSGSETAPQRCGLVYGQGGLVCAGSL